MKSPCTDLFARGGGGGGRPHARELSLDGMEAWRYERVWGGVEQGKRTERSGVIEGVSRGDPEAQQGKGTLHGGQ